MDDFEFDAESACRLIAEEIEWQLTEWRREIEREMRWPYGSDSND